MEFNNKQEAIKFVKAHLKKEVISSREQMEMVKRMMKFGKQVDKLSLKCAVSLVKISIHLHNFNIVEVRKEQQKYNNIVSDILNEYLFDDKKPACVITNGGNATPAKYMGEGEKCSENARQIGEALIETTNHINEMISVIIKVNKL